METIVSPNTLNKIIGPIAQKNLPRTKDDKFELYWNKKKNAFMIGNSIVGIDHDDITIDNEKYKGTHGLWRLLTYKDAPDNVYYTQDDLKNYVKILFDTESMYKNNDQNTGTPKFIKGKSI